MATVDAQWSAAGNQTPVPRPTFPTMMASCPRVPAVGIAPVEYVAEKGDVRHQLYVTGKALVNRANVVSGAGKAYALYAGATDDDPDQGLIIVSGGISDPCADPMGKEHYVHQIRTPLRQGAVRIVGIEADTVVFAAERGGGGRFNYVSEQFGEVPAGAFTPTVAPIRTPSGP